MLRGRLTRCKIYVNIEYAYVPLVMYIVCCIYAFVGVLNKYDYDFCRRKHDGDYIIKLYTMGIIHGIPAILTVIFYYAAISAMKDLVARPLRRAANYYREFPMVFLNLIAFVVFVVMWLPFTIATIVEADERHYLYSSRFGLLRSVFVNLLYPIAHIDFRNAFICIFEYCFCRYTLQ
ncbi:jg27489, partial [Pararge aegeria aegeria]